ncbi:hypothetical protein EZ030_13845 [Enterococcus gallinarum]|nr:hypothetical protein [Enterococcus gallinarum]
MEQYQPSWIKLLFFFLIFMGADLMKQVIVHHFAWLDVLQLMNFLVFILLSFFIRQLPSTLRKILIGTYLFIIGGIMSLLFGNPFELASWTLYFVGAFFGTFLWDHFCQRFRLRWFTDKIIR